ncbi:MAG TPA: dipicolinate synthase subunit DpsA [Ruminococcus sp.]|nr:dipicolinate synthase subunit DpsA [Ruminococcus sp.]
MKMTDIKSFGIIGGDKRQLFLAKAIYDSGYAVMLGGFDRLRSTGNLVLGDIKAVAAKCDVMILPVPSVRADGSINTPFSDECTVLDDELIGILIKKPVFIAMKDKFIKAYPQFEKAEIFDYAAKDEFAILNALPTAEGAVEVAMNKFEGTIAGSRCLITGYGRIGKVLAEMLKNLKAEVTVSARKPSDMAFAQAFGYDEINTNKMSDVRNFDLVFNTVPSMIFNRELLLNTDKNTIIIDLASLPGGVDFEAAHILGIDAVRALALPGKCAPKTAGEIIKTTVFNTIEEVYR